MAMIILIAFVAASCEKEEGPQGPAGANGTDGKDGNANVTVYGFTGDTLTTSSTWKDYFIPITPGAVDSSIILPYYFTYGYWYLAGGLGYGAGYLTRFGVETSIPSARVFIGIFNPDGAAYTGTDVIWDSIRIFVVPATIFKSARAKNIDFNNYKEVKAYYQEKL